MDIICYRCRVKEGNIIGDESDDIDTTKCVPTTYHIHSNNPLISVWKYQ